MPLPRFKDLPLAFHGHYRAHARDPVGAAGATPGPSNNDPPELNEGVHPADADRPQAEGGDEPRRGDSRRGLPAGAWADAWAEAREKAMVNRGNTSSADSGARGGETGAGRLPPEAGTSRAAGFDGIPVLTDVVEVPGEPGGPAPARVTAGTLPAWDPDPDPRLTEAVLRRLSSRAGELLDAPLQAALAPLMARLAATLADELREPLERAVRGAVARAVQEELNQLRPDHADPHPTSRRP